MIRIIIILVLLLMIVGAVLFIMDNSSYAEYVGGKSSTSGGWMLLPNGEEYVECDTTNDCEQAIEWVAGGYYKHISSEAKCAYGVCKIKLY